MAKRINLPFHSRYPKTKLFQLRSETTDALTNEYAWGTWYPIDFDADQTDLIHIVKDHELGRLDLVSYKYYGTVYFWWIIAHVNNILDPLDHQFEEYGSMWVGQRIRIPNRDRVFTRMISGESSDIKAQESITLDTVATMLRR